MKLFRQSLLLILSFIIVFVWQQTFLSQYTIQTLGFLIFLFLLLSARKKNFNPISASGNSSSWSIFIVNTTVFLLIFSTGGLSSALFFLLYFLGFGIAFVFEPLTVFVFMLGTILIFLPEVLKGDILENALRVGSLGLISPLAFFFGREFRREEKQEDTLSALGERTKDAADTIAQDVEAVLQQEKQTLKPEAVEKLNEILEETENLREETKE